MIKSKVFVAMGLIVAFLVLISPAALARSASRSHNESLGNTVVGATSSLVSTIQNVNRIKTGTCALQGNVRILGHDIRAFDVNINVRQVNLSPPEPRFTITIANNSLTVCLHGINRNFNIISVGMQIFVGPVPVRVSAGLVASVRASIEHSISRGMFTVGPTFSTGLGASLTAAAGIPVAYIGIQGSASPLTVTLPIRLEFRPATISAYVDITIGASADVAVVVRIWWIEYRHVLARWPIWNRTWRIIEVTL